MNKKIKRIVNIGIVAVLLVVGFLPLLRLNAYATSYGEGNFSLKVGFDYNDGATLNSLSVNGFNWTSDQDTYSTSNGQYTININYQLGDGDEGYDSGLMTSQDLSPYFAIIGEADNQNGEVTVSYSFDYSSALEDQNIQQFDRLSLNVFVNRNDQNGPDGLQGNMQATIKVCGENHANAAFLINSEDHWYKPEPVDSVPGQNCSEFTYRYNGADDDETVEIGFSTLWHEKFVGNVIVNTVDYDVPIDYDDEFSWLEHYSGQVVAFRTAVPKANDNKYNITVNVGDNDKKYIGNFLWTADPEQEWEIMKDEEGNFLRDENGDYIYNLDENGEKKPNYNYIGHSRIEPVAVSYVIDGKTYSCNIDTDTCFVMINPNEGEEDEEPTYEMLCSISTDQDCGIPYIEYATDPNVEYDDGILVIPAGSRVTMRIIPDYGYQILNVNMSELVTDNEGVGEFTFTVPAGAAYFKADVIKMEDKVNSKTNKVVGGSIDLGDEQTTLTRGTARLDISDAEISDEDKEAFASAAGDFAVKSYLDISLFNVVCKGGETCADTDDESWNNQVRDLNEAATITLNLEDGVDGNEIVIVHQKHDGTYEIIPTTYDPVTHTITFTTTSFSNYAIASRTVESPETGSFTEVSGGSVVSVYGLSIVLTSVAIIAIICYNRRHDSE